MFNNIWTGLQNWFKHNQGYKASEDRYGEELVNQIVILNEIDTDKIGEEVEGVILDTISTWQEWVDKEDALLYNYNGWLDDKVSKYDFIQRAYKDIMERVYEYDEEPEQILRYQVDKLIQMGRTMNDILSSHKSTKEQLDHSRQDKRKLEKEKADLIYQVRELKERAFKELQELATKEQLHIIDKARDMFYGVFSYGDLFKEQIYDWIRDAMESDSERVVPCGSDLAERCEGIVQEHENNSEGMYDIAREVIDDYEFEDVLYNHDIPNEDTVNDMISEGSIDEDDFHELFEDAIENHTINKSGVDINIQSTVKETLIQMLQLLTNDLSKKGITDKAITVTKDEAKDE